MKVRMTVEVDDEYRRGLRRWLGRKGRATREEIRQHIAGMIHADLETFAVLPQGSMDLDGFSR